MKTKYFFLVIFLLIACFSTMFAVTGHPSDTLSNSEVEKIKSSEIIKEEQVKQKSGKPLNFLQKFALKIITKRLAKKKKEKSYYMTGNITLFIALVVVAGVLFSTGGLLLILKTSLLGLGFFFAILGFIIVAVLLYFLFQQISAAIGSRRRTKLSNKAMEEREKNKTQ